MSESQDPKLLYAVNGVSAYHIANGKEESLTPGGSQTLSLLMVPTSSPFADSALDAQGGASEEDFYLHLHLPPELDLPLPATTQIYHQPPTSYLIPRWDLGPDSGAFTRIEFPELGARKGVQEDVDTFETILAQCTAFLERAPPPKIIKGKKSEKSTTSPSSSKSKSALADELPAYNPADYLPGEGYVQGSHSSNRGGQIVLVDEEDGSVIGELGDGFQVVEDTQLKPGSKGRRSPILNIHHKGIANTRDNRPCADNTSTRWESEHSRSASFAGGSRDHSAPSLQEIILSIKCRCGFTINCHNVRLCVESVAEPGRQFYQEDPTKC